MFVPEKVEDRLEDISPPIAARKIGKRGSVEVFSACPCNGRCIAHIPKKPVLEYCVNISSVHPGVVIKGGGS